MRHHPWPQAIPHQVILRVSVVSLLVTIYHSKFLGVLQKVPDRCALYFILLTRGPVLWEETAAVAPPAFLTWGQKKGRWTSVHPEPDFFLHSHLKVSPCLCPGGRLC